MIKGFLVILESGTPIYSFFEEKGMTDRELLVSGFITAIQAFAKEALLTPDGGDIQSMTLSQSLLTFRALNIRDKNENLIQYFFVLLSDLQSRKDMNAEAFLEYLCLNFLSYNFGQFRKKMRETLVDINEFKEFDAFIADLITCKWKDIKKKMKPLPASLLQGLLNDLRDYLPIDQILKIHPKFVRLGPSYVWISDDFSSEEEQEILGKIKEILSKLFGGGLYESLIQNIEDRLKLIKSC